MTRTLFACACVVAFGGCLKGETVPIPPDRCNCYGVQCRDNRVVRLQATDDAEEGDPCLRCNDVTIGTCAEGCVTGGDWDVQGCSVAYACKTWTRAKVGAACTTTFDCEPGEVDGKASNTLVCEAGACKDVGAAKFATVPAKRECKDGPYAYGPTTECNGGGCVGESEYSEKQYCSVAKCIVDSDCPSGWMCRCQEQTTTSGLKAWRWCTPHLTHMPPDAGK